MNIQYIHPADQLVMFMQRKYDKGMTTTSGGNLSILDEEGNIWITAIGILTGAVFLNVADKVTPHLHHVTGVDQETHSEKQKNINIFC